ncbi:MAG: hypothetical protein ABIQ64_02595 [Candidatus Saccharimonadales bacterium]
MKIDVDTDSVRTAHTTTVKDKASTFWANLEDSLDGLGRSEQIQLFDRLNAVVGTKDSFTAFVNGTYAQDSTGSPAKAIGAGTSTKSPEESALDTIMASPSVPDGVKMAIQRIITPGPPDYIKVENDGTPSEIVSLRKQVTDLTNQRDTTMSNLLDEKDPTKKGSLAEQLQEAKATPATPADMVKKDDILPLVDELKASANKLSSSRTSAEVKGKDELLDKIDEINEQLS